MDEGLQKLKLGKDLIKKCRGRLQQVENEFVKIKQEFCRRYGRWRISEVFAESSRKLLSFKSIMERLTLTTFRFNRHTYLIQYIAIYSDSV